MARTEEEQKGISLLGNQHVEALNEMQEDGTTRKHIVITLHGTGQGLETDIVSTAVTTECDELVIRGDLSLLL